jgi:DNA-binding GntR family transcriptional regulator
MPAPPETATLELRSLQQQIHDRLLGQILRGELNPGDRISPPEIAGTLGVSITPVRDAVNQMSAEGLVIVTPRRGTIVAPIEIRDIKELYEIRLMVEPRAAEVAAQKATDRDIARMRDLAEQLESTQAVTEGRVDDLEAYLRAISTDAEFHAAVVATMGNHRLDTLYEGLRTHVLIARTIFPRLYQSQPHRRGEHQRVIDAIAAHDSPRAHDAMASHLQQALADTLRHVESSSDGEEPARSSVS